MKFPVITLFIVLLCSDANNDYAQQPANRIPPPGIPVPEAVRARLGEKLGNLQRELQAIEQAEKRKRVNP